MKNSKYLFLFLFSVLSQNGNCQSLGYGVNGANGVPITTDPNYSSFPNGCQSVVPPCNPSTPYTSPTACVAPYTQPWMVNQFNWFSPGAGSVGQPVFYYNISTNGPVYRLNSPFTTGYSCSSGNDGNPSDDPLYPLCSTQDNLPSNGWELIRQDFGYLQNNNSQSNPDGCYNHDMPYIILYNIYSGVLRVIGWWGVGQSTTNQNVIIALSLHDPSNLAGTSGSVTTGLFNFYGNSCTALDQQAPNSSIYAIAQNTNPTGCADNKCNPFYADFNLAYDPCACQMYRTLIVKFIGLTNSTVLQNLSNQGGTSPTYNWSSYVSSSPNDLSQAGSYGNVSAGITSYLNIADLTAAVAGSTDPSQTNSSDASDIATGLANAGSLLSSASAAAASIDVAEEAISKAAEDAKKAAKDAAEAAAATKAAAAAGTEVATDLEVASGVLGTAAAGTIEFPIAAAVLGVAALVCDVISIGISASQPAPTQQSVAISNNVQPFSDAIIESQSTPITRNIALPGSNMSTTSNSNPTTQEFPTLGILYPMYNEPLGVFGLLKTPSVYINPLFVGAAGYTALVESAFHIPTDQTNFQYAFNPALNINSYQIRASLEIYNLVTYGASADAFILDDFTKRTFTADYGAYNINLAGTVGEVAQYNTPFLPLECLGDLLPSFTCDTEVLPSIGTFYYFIKLIVQVAYNSPNNTFQNYILKYPLNVVNPLTSGSYGQLPKPSPSTVSNNYQNNISIPTTSYTSAQTINAFNTIAVTGSLTNSVSNPVVLQAGDAVSINAGTSGASISGNFTLLVEEPLSCNTPNPNYTSDQLKSYCGGINLNQTPSNTGSGVYSAYSTPAPSNGRMASGLTANSASPTPESSGGLTAFAAQPNPFTGSTSVSYYLPQGTNVKITLSDLTGHNSKDLVNSFQTAGRYSISLSSDGLAAGVYLLSMISNTYTGELRLVVIK